MADRSSEARATPAAADKTGTREFVAAARRLGGCKPPTSKAALAARSRRRAAATDHDGDA
jgi:hypothetical protein